MATMNIHHERRRLGISQFQLAERLGVTQATVSRWETGRLEMSMRDRLALEHLLANWPEQVEPTGSEAA